MPVSSALSGLVSEFLLYSAGLTHPEVVLFVNPSAPQSLTGV